MAAAPNPSASPRHVPGRRRLIAAAGAGAAAALLAACGIPLPPLRPVDPARAPRVGDTWRYGYRSDWQNVAPRSFDVTVVSVADQGIVDRLALADQPAPFFDRLFTSQLEIAARPLAGVQLLEFSPYLEAFGPLPAEGIVLVPQSSWGTRWTASARVRGAEQLSVAAGTFTTTRIDIFGWRPFIPGQMDDAIDPIQLYATAWLAAAPKRLVRFSLLTQAAQLNPLIRDHIELLSYRVG
jgi:hypothetical protein